MTKIPKICVVDDDKVHTFILLKLIQKLDLCETIVSYPNGEKAIEAFKLSLEKGENLPNVILLDINMPEMDGWQFIEEFRTLKSLNGLKTSIYISSSSISAEDTEKAESYEEISSYLIKPIEPKTLLNIVQKNWENKRE